MKKKDLKALRTKNEQDIRSTLEKKRAEVLDGFLKVKTGKQKNKKVIRTLRKDVAQILTILREREIVKDMEKVVEDKNRKGGKK